jgi:hypothetical protein
LADIAKSLGEVAVASTYFLTRSATATKEQLRGRSRRFVGQVIKKSRRFR